MNWLGSVLLVMASCGLGCAEPRSADHTVTARGDGGQPSASRAQAGRAQSSEPAANSDAPAPQSAAQRPHAQDAAAGCSGSGSLADYCARAECPQLFSVAQSYLCEAADAPHQIAKNSCSGMSAVHHAADGDTRYDFGEEGELLGVTLSGAKETCGESDLTYGRACSVIGVPETFCDRGCGFIACAAGLSIYLDAPNPKDYQSASIKFCRNDLCASGSFNATIEAASGSKEIAYHERLSDYSTMMFVFTMDRPTPWLFIYFEAPEKNLRHGDHYFIEVKHLDGHELYMFEQTIARYDLSETNPPCTQYCKVKGFDSRTPLPDSSDVDAGTP